MTVISIRLNAREDKILQKLRRFYNKDKSSLIKDSLNEMYEHMMDSKVIATFEGKEKKSRSKFSSADEILNNFS